MPTQSAHGYENLDGKRYLGVDPSLTCTGLALLEERRLSTWTLKPGCVGINRLIWFKGTMTNQLRALCPTAVILEGYSYGSPSSAHPIGELGGILRVVFWELGLPLYIIAPNTLKKFVTGHGQGGKGPIPLHLYKRWGVTVEQEDEADAAGLAFLGLYAENPEIPRIMAQREALEKVNAVRPPLPPRIRSRPGVD